MTANLKTCSDSLFRIARSLTKAVLTKDITINNYTLKHRGLKLSTKLSQQQDTSDNEVKIIQGDRRIIGKGLKMSNTSTRRHIVISPKNFDLLKNYGRACDSMNDAVTEVLRIASREGENPHRGII
jgi:hypothetical protein